MGKSVNGLDMQSCSTYLFEIQKNTNCVVSVLMELDGSAGGSGFKYACVATSRELTVDGPLWSATATARFPCRAHTTFEGCLFDCIRQLDIEIDSRQFHEKLGIT